MKNTIKKIVVYILTLESKIALKRHKPFVVAITGSVGKTSTKDAVYTALTPFFHVRKSAKSFNSEIGIPLTILGLENPWNDTKQWILNIIRGAFVALGRSYPTLLVLEIGADRPGEIKSAVSWIKPDISIVTRVGKVPVHVEFYKSPAQVAKEKSELVKGTKSDGVVILNADDPDVVEMKALTSAKIITFGIKEHADLYGSYISVAYDKEENPSGMTARVDLGGNSFPIVLKDCLGVQHIYPVLAAFAVAHAKGVNLLEVSEAFSLHESPKGRMHIIKGINNSTIIDDTYNASPTAVEEGLKLVESLKILGRKIVVVGDMLELGKHSSSEHRRLGEIAGKVSDIVASVGIRSKEFAHGALEVGADRENVLFFENSIDAGKKLIDIIKKGDVVYVKGSQSMRMERVVEALMAEPEKKSELLVRQEIEWLKRP